MLCAPAEGTALSSTYSMGTLLVGFFRCTFIRHKLTSFSDVGHFAVKKIAVGQSHSYLLDILREASRHILPLHICIPYVCFLAGSTFGEITPSEYHTISPLLARELSILNVRPQGPYTTVCKLRVATCKSLNLLLVC